MVKLTQIITINCPRCKSGHVVKNGTKREEQRFRCQDCRRTFSYAEETGFRQKCSAEPVGAAIRLFYSGASYKQIAENMEDMFDIPEPSKSVICQWVKDNTDAALNVMERHPAHASRNWVADQIVFDVDGEKIWNWNVMDYGTWYILAPHLSKERSARAARTTMRKALKAAP